MRPRRPESGRRDRASIAEIPREHVRCPGCEASRTAPYAVYRDVDYGVPGLWNLVRCESCGLIYLNPRPSADALHLIYPPNYVPYQMELRPDTRLLMRFAIVNAYEGAKLKIVETAGVARGSRILDVGCGAGFFLTLLGRKGWQAVGLEPNPVLVERATRELGLNVVLGTPATAQLDAGSFGAITLWHCLEHSPTPRQTLEQCHRWLEASGVVVGQVPDNDSWEARRLGNYFWGNDIPRHLVFFTRATLTAVAERCGFDVVRLWRTRNATSWLWSLLRWSGWDLYAEMERNILTISLLYACIAPFYYLFSRGDWLTFVLKKKSS